MTATTDSGPSAMPGALALALFVGIATISAYGVFWLVPDDFDPVLLLGGAVGFTALWFSSGFRFWLGALAALILVAYIVPAGAAQNLNYGALLVGFTFTTGTVLFAAAGAVGLVRSRRRVRAAAAAGIGWEPAPTTQPDTDLCETDDYDDDTLIVGLCGYAGSGKDTAAKGLLWEGWQHGSFAKKLKDVCLAINPLISVHRGMPGFDFFNIADTPILYVRFADYVGEVGMEAAKANFEVRALLQRTGTDAGRNILGGDVWVNAAMDDLPDGDVVFTDVRFPNEAQAIQSAGGYVIRVVRPGCAAVNGHESETALDDYPVDATIVNDGDRLALGAALRDALHLLDIDG